MKRYCYNYSIEGVRTILPLFVAFKDIDTLTEDESFNIAVKLAEKESKKYGANKKVTVYR